MDRQIGDHEEECERTRRRFLNERADEDFERRKIETEKTNDALRAEHVASRKNDQLQQLAFEKQQRQELETKLEVLNKEYEDERHRLEQFSGATADLQFAQDELNVATAVLMKLRDRVAAIRTERRQDGAVRTLAIATPPNSPTSKMPVKNLAVASGACFILPFLIGFLWEFKVKRVVDSTALEKAGNLAPIVGEIARLPGGTRSDKSRRVFEESVDTLRANLFLSMDTRNTRSIAVTSSMSGEGKSSVASQLALSIAKATGDTVLLVDADLRCPDQHEVFGLEMGPGLCGVLSHESTLEEAVDTSLGDLIHVLPAGRATRSPHRLMSQSAMLSFVDQALEKYAVVVIDTAPVLAAGETLAVASSVDATLLCLMRDVSRMENVTRIGAATGSGWSNHCGHRVQWRIPPTILLSLWRLSLCGRFRVVAVVIR